VLVHEVNGLNEAKRFVNVSADGKVVDGDLRGGREGGREQGEVGKRGRKKREGRRDGGRAPKYLTQNALRVDDKESSKSHAFPVSQEQKE